MSGGTAVVERTFERSLVQRMTALERANEVRSFRAELKVEIKAGRPVAPLLREPPADLASMHVFDLLMAMPKVGRVKVQKVLFRNAISASKTVGGLSQRQRDILALETAGGRLRL